MLLLPIPVLAGDNVLSVKCVDQSGKAVTGTKVVIQQLPQGKSKDKKSDKQGLARFDKLDNGVYRVFSRKDGFSPALYEFAILKGQADQTIELKFAPGSEKDQLYFENQEVAQKSFTVLQEGVKALQANDFADAENKLRTSLQFNPSNPDARFNLGLAYIQQHKWDEAEDALKKASLITEAFMELIPKDDQRAANYQQMHGRIAGLLEKLPGLRLRVEAGEDLAAKKFEDARQKYLEALKSFPDDPDLYYNLALAQANMKNYDDAIKSIDKAVELRPGEDAYKKLQKQIGDYKVNEQLTEAKGILEESDKLYQAGKYAEALPKYQSALPLIPEKNQGVVWVLIAKSQAHLNQPDAAVQSFKKAIEIAPDNMTFRKELAQFYMGRKEYDQALDVYADTATKGASRDQTLMALGREMAKNNNTDVALLAFQKALEVNPDDSEVYYEMGVLYFYNKKDSEKAKEMFTKYLEAGSNQDHVNTAKNLMVVIDKQKAKP